MIKPEAKPQSNAVQTDARYKVDEICNDGKCGKSGSTTSSKEESNSEKDDDIECSKNSNAKDKIAMKIFDDESQK